MGSLESRKSVMNLAKVFILLNLMAGLKPSPIHNTIFTF